MDQELVQYLEGRFQHIDERFENIDKRFENINERFQRQEQRFSARFDGIDQRFDELKRYTGILAEDLRREVQLVAESLAMHIQVQHVQEREYFDRKFGDTDALIRSSYNHLQQQQDQTRQRVENLERNQQN